MIKQLLSSLLILALGGQLSAQTPAINKCWSIDYETWNTTDQPALFIDCGNDDAFNVGEELTMELWIRAYTFAENRKLMGKIEYHDPIDNGYVLGFENLHVYAEYFNPNNQQVARPGDGPMPADSSFVHIVSTYSSVSGKIKNYVNGFLAGETTMFPSAAIVTNERPFIIGNAPWDLLSYQFYGDMDEVRIWNTERTHEQIQQYMHQQLQGNEEGLIAYYNFNEANADLVPDASSNGFDGTLSNFDHESTSWSVSGAPVGNRTISQLNMMGAAWFSNQENDYAISSDQGISIYTDIQDKQFRKYVVAAHDGGQGVSSDNIPDNNPEGFIRSDREWYLDCSENVTGNIIFNFTEAASGGELLPSTGSAPQYAILYRENSSDAFKAIATTSFMMQDILQFAELDLKTGYYAIGYSTEEFSIDDPTALEEEYLKNVRIAPNPVNDYLSIKGLPIGTQISIININGVCTHNFFTHSGSEKIDLNQNSPGMYFIRMNFEGQQSIKKIIKK